MLKQTRGDLILSGHVIHITAVLERIKIFVTSHEESKSRNLLLFLIDNAENFEKKPTVFLLAQMDNEIQCVEQT